MERKGSGDWATTDQIALEQLQGPKRLENARRIVRVFLRTNKRDLTKQIDGRPDFLVRLQESVRALADENHRLRNGTEVNSVYECPFCDQSFKEKELMRDHVIANHNIITPMVTETQKMTNSPEDVANQLKEALDDALEQSYKDRAQIIHELVRGFNSRISELEDMIEELMATSDGLTDILEPADPHSSVTGYNSDSIAQSDTSDEFVISVPRDDESSHS